MDGKIMVFMYTCINSTKNYPKLYRNFIFLNEEKDEESNENNDDHQQQCDEA